MIGMDSDHCQVVAESLRGQREVDNRTFAALAVLRERLERLKKIDGAFAEVTFSPDVIKLQSQRRTAAVV
ncbi:MAG: hypothetical protein JW715_01940 [Sedimentisphaerales bacterium]|nr:hypothetical protein [Sedimentisphaerales bacterium]